MSWRRLPRKGRRSRQGVGWGGHSEHSVSPAHGETPEPWLGGSLALALTLARSELENPAQSDAERAISLPQGASTGAVRCAGKLGPAFQRGGCGRAERAPLAHRGRVGPGQSSSSTVSKQETGLGFHCSVFQQVSTARVIAGKSHHWAQPGHLWHQ